jgi:osmoprotectant transport system ATP-binding protein
MAGRYPGQLSGGQQQRVGVARALAADPPVLLMDEPFSAVDPVVRESLQDELLKLQSDLGKTIVFVTHDIDEAIKLGDRVAVFRVGGKLAQYDEPGVLLSRPADDFVDNFVGRDRGYRGLSFLSSEALPLGELRTAHGGEQAEQGWTLVLDPDDRPLGWHHDRTGGATVDVEDLVPGGSLYDTADGSLRSALDAALSSPSGQGVAVDGDGRAVGSVAADDVLSALADVRRAEAAA